ncbi:MAG: phage holin family protein [Nitrospirae bacterium]|nr:phage holin family protein [Nitrospirota bacterium]
MDIKNYVLRWLINAVGLFIVSKLMASIEIDGILTAVVAAAVIGIINIFLRPILIILTLPINILSLGLFTLVINGLIFYFVGNIVEGFHVAGFLAAFIGALILSIINILATFLIGMGKGKAFIHIQRRGD